MQGVRVCIVYIAGILLVGTFAESGLAWSLVMGLLGALAIALPSALSITSSRPTLILRASIPMTLVGASMLVALLLIDETVGPYGLWRVIWGGSIGIACLLMVSLLNLGRIRASLG